VFLKLFYSIAPFSFMTRHFCSPSLINQTQGSKFKELSFTDCYCPVFRPKIEEVSAHACFCLKPAQCYSQWSPYWVDSHSHPKNFIWHQTLQVQSHDWYKVNSCFTQQKEVLVFIILRLMSVVCISTTGITLSTPDWQYKLIYFFCIKRIKLFVYYEIYLK